MEKLNFLLETNDTVWFEISEGDKQEFLSFAKALGCSWSNGKPVLPNQDSCGFHMSIHKNRTIAFIPYYVWFANNFSDIPKYDFHAFLKGNLITPNSHLVHPVSPVK